MTESAPLLLIFAGLIGLTVYVLIRRMVGSPSDSARLHNALLAEHTLSLVELVPENPFARSLKNAVIETYREFGFPDWPEERVVEVFNELNRIEQLNVLATALNELGHSPVLQNAEWLPVKTPFGGDFDESFVASVSTRLTTKFQAPIKLDLGQFVITEWGIKDVQLPRSEDKDHTDTSLTSPRKQSFGPYTVVSSFVREYQLQDYSAKFIDEPALDGPIEYLYALVVTRNSDGQIEFIVGAEKPYRLPGISDLIDSDEGLKEHFGGTVELDDGSSKSIVLGVLSSDGHMNYGSSPKWADPQLFIVKALKIARERLGIDH